jgi:hypothetical protein
MILIKHFYAFILYVSDSDLQCNTHNSYWNRVQYQDIQTAQESWYGPVEMILSEPENSSVNINLTGPYITYWPRKKSIIDKYYIYNVLLVSLKIKYQHIIILLFKNTIKLENCLLQVECNGSVNAVRNGQYPDLNLVT